MPHEIAPTRRRSPLYVPQTSLLALSQACGLRSAVELRSTLESSLEAREMLILSNMRLVVNLARRSQRSLPRIGARGVDRDGGAAI